jgi:hypothetical protein
MSRGARWSLVLLTVLSSAAVADEGTAPDNAASDHVEETLWTVSLGSSGSVAGANGNVFSEVKPFHNARKYGFNRGLYDATPSYSIYVGRRISSASPFFVELGYEWADHFYESPGAVAGSSTGIGTEIFSVMVAPIYRTEFRAKSLEFGVSWGCRLGWSSFNALVESSTPSALLGREKQSSNIFATEPFVRFDTGLNRWLRLGFDSGFASRNFWQIFNSEGSGVYAASPLSEKNPDGTDTAVDLSGWTDKLFLAAEF